MDKEDATINFVLAFFIISANLIVVIALFYMKSAKKSTLVFLSQMALANMVQGGIILSRGLFFLWHVQNSVGCLVSIMFTIATTGHYVTSILYVYLDLYLSLKKMSIVNPIVSAKLATAMSLLSFAVWLGLGAVGYAFSNPAWDLDWQSGCDFGSGQHTSTYILFIVILFLILFLVILTCHVMTLRLLKSSFIKMEQNQQMNAGATKTLSLACVETIAETEAAKAQQKATKSQQSKWLQKNATVIRMMLIILVVFVVCWYPIMIFLLIVNMCESCRRVIPPWVIYITRILVTLQYISNGLVYLVKVKEFKNVCKRLCCRCVPKCKVAPMDSSSEPSKIQNKMVANNM